MEFTDINATFTEDSEDIVVKNLAAIRKQNVNIISTEIGSCHFEPTFGSLVPALLFEPMGYSKEDKTDITAWKIETAIYKAIKRWQPRIYLVTSKSTVVADCKARKYTATLFYLVKVDRITDTQIIDISA